MEGLCYLKLFNSNADESSKCTERLLNKPPLIELNEICHFQCELKQHNILIRQVGTNEYVITDFKNKLEVFDHQNNNLPHRTSNYRHQKQYELTCHTTKKQH